MTSDTTEADDNLLLSVIDFLSKRTQPCVFVEKYVLGFVLFLHLYHGRVCTFQSQIKTGETTTGHGQHYTQEIAVLSRARQFQWAEKAKLLSQLLMCLLEHPDKELTSQSEEKRVTAK